MGSVWCICARGTCSGPSRCWSGPWVCARTGTFRSSCPGWPQPWAWRMPWMGVSPRVWRWWNTGWSKRSPGADRGVWRLRSPASARRICWLAAWKTRANAPRRRSISPASTSNAAHQAWALWLLGESTARQASPEVEPAAGHYRQALALAEELGMRPLQAHCHRGLGTLYATTGQREQARAALSTAIELYRAMAMTFWLPQAEIILAQVA